MLNTQSTDGYNNLMHVIAIYNVEKLINRRSGFFTDLKWTLSGDS